VLFSCKGVLFTAAGAEHHTVYTLKIIRHLTASAAHAHFDMILPVDLDKIREELVLFV
jgi:hypothetical protein